MYEISKETYKHLSEKMYSEDDRELFMTSIVEDNKIKIKKLEKQNAEIKNDLKDLEANQKSKIDSTCDQIIKEEKEFMEKSIEEHMLSKSEMYDNKNGNLNSSYDLNILKLTKNDRKRIIAEILNDSTEKSMNYDERRIYFVMSDEDKNTIIGSEMKKSEIESLKTINKFFESYKNKEHVIELINIKNQKSKLSLRIIDLYVRDPLVKMNNVFDMIKDYKLMLKFYGKKEFDPFARGEKFTYANHKFGMFRETTIGQLNFFKWIIEYGIMEHMMSNIDIISQMYTPYYTHQKRSLDFESLSSNEVISQPILKCEKREYENIFSNKKEPLGTSNFFSNNIERLYELEDELSKIEGNEHIDYGISLLMKRNVTDNTNCSIKFRVNRKTTLVELMEMIESKGYHINDKIKIVIFDKIYNNYKGNGIYINYTMEELNLLSGGTFEIFNL